jgi:hypothetical protein
MPEKPDEEAACQIVASALGVQVSRFEDGRANSQVDALIHDPNGPSALEIVGDHEDAFNAQWKALERIDHVLNVPGLIRVWTVVLTRAASVRRIARDLPPHLLDFDTNYVATTYGRARRKVSPEMARLGVIHAYPVDGDSRLGRVNLHAEGWSGSTGAATMAEYVERILAEADDVPSKLAAHPSPDKHAFIWATIGTDYGVQAQLENRDMSLPQQAPALPNGVTHVWVAGSFTSQGVLTWFPDRGWWRPDRT